MEEDEMLPWEDKNARKKLKKQKEPGFIAKLKAKVDKLFQDENLTIMGKVFMVSLYALIMCTIALIPIDVIHSIIKFSTEYYHLPSAGIGLGTVKALLIVLFSFCLLFIIVLTAIEGAVYAESDGDESFLTIKN